MATTYELIAKQTLTGTATSVAFSSIPQIMDDMVLIVSAREAGNAAFSRVLFTFNDPPQSTPISYRMLNAQDVGGGTYGVTSGSGTTNVISAYGVAQDYNTTANVFGSMEVYFPNYSSSSVNKSWSWHGNYENNAVTPQMISVGAGLWASTSPISKLTITTPAPSGFAVNSSFYLYGITKA